MENDLIKFIAGSLIGSGLIAFIVRSLFQHILNNDIEKFKSDLNKSVIEHQIKFNKLHFDRTEVLKTMIPSLYNLKNEMLNLTTLAQGPEFIKDDERANKAKIAYEQFSEIYNSNKYFFNQDFCTKIDEIIFLIDKAGNDFSVAKFLRQINSNEGLKDSTKYWKEAYEAMNKNLQPLIQELEQQLREIVGTNK